MPKPQTLPPPAVLRALALRLAKLAQVSQNYQNDFCERISRTLLTIFQWDRRSTGAKPGYKLVEAADAARILQKTFFRLKEQDRDWVEGIKQSQMQFTAGKIDDLETTILNLSMLLNQAVGRPSPVPRRLETVSRSVKDQILRELVFGLLGAATDEGGIFTYDKNSETGTLANALDLLRGHLPDGLVPEPLRASTIQRLKTEFYRLRRR
jgi:hypothetical protein